MPQVLPAVAFAAFNAGAPLVAVNAILGIGVAGVVLHTAVSTAISVGASYAIAKLTAPPMPKPSNGSLEFKQPIPVRFFTYGHTKVSGPVLLLETGTSGQSLFKITAFGTREIGSFVKYFNDGEDVTSGVVPSGVAGVTTIPVVRDVDGSHGEMFFHIGSDSQLVDQMLLDDYPPWTSDHRLRGIPYSATRMDAINATTHQEAFPNGPIETAVVGGVRVYDPRLDSTNGGTGSHRRLDPETWTFSDNQRLCTLDWLTWKDGYAKPWDRIDWASWVPQINLADQNVPLKGGGTERRYRVATRVGLDEPRSRVLHRLLQAGDQQLYVTADGLIGSRGGEWKLPTVSLEAETNFTEAFFQAGVPKMERINEFQLTAMLPERDYTEFELEPWKLAGDPEHAAGIIRRAPLELTQVPSNGQAQRLAKIYMAKRNPRWSGQVRTTFAGLDALGEDKVSLSFAELDIAGPFWINGKISFLPNKTGLTIPVASADPDSYAWVPSVDEQNLPAAPPIEALMLDEEREAA